MACDCALTLFSWCLSISRPIIFVAAANPIQLSRWQQFGALPSQHHVGSSVRLPILARMDRQRQHLVVLEPNNPVPAPEDARGYGFRGLYQHPRSVFQSDRAAQRHINSSRFGVRLSQSRLYVGMGKSNFLTFLVKLTRLLQIVVEMRALALSSYVFKSSPVLTPERAECVMNEITLINSFFDDIMEPSLEEVEDATLAAIRYQRREALRQLLTLKL